MEWLIRAKNSGKVYASHFVFMTEDLHGKLMGYLVHPWGAESLRAASQSPGHHQVQNTTAFGVESI